MMNLSQKTPPLRLPAHEAIIEAGFQIWSQNPRASLAEIALAAGVGRATLHRHFKGRDDLMHALATRSVEEIGHIANQAAKGAWSYTIAMEKVFYALVASGERHWFLMRGDVERFPDIKAQLEQQNIEFMDVIRRAQKEGLFPVSCPIAWVMQSYDLMVYGAWQMVRDEHATSQQASKLAWHMFKAGLKKAKI
ncbi:MAG: hypothetical protein COA43_05755 [Robiginitomaculum sp.]|nr:MAG: hypothetical protein COA43_05755 [Robiginitomaculum sp.]